VIEDLFHLADFITLQLGKAPVLAVVCGFAMSWGLTQWFKFYIPQAWTPLSRQTASRMVAMASGVATTYALDVTTRGIVSGLLVGLWSPYSFRAAMVLIGYRWPELREALSQDIEVKP